MTAAHNLLGPRMVIGDLPVAGVVALGLALGALLLLTGIVIMVVGARYGLDAAMRAADTTSEGVRNADQLRPPPPPADRRAP